VIEVKTITIRAFKSSDDKPACSIGIEPEKTCRFLGFRRYGMQGVCMAINEDVHRNEPLDYIRPHARCIAWSAGESQP
jgi:hypothetical protein